MYFTWRFISVFLGYTLLFAIFPGEWLISLSLLIFILVGLVDVWLTLREPRLIVERILPDAVYRQATFNVELVIVNPGRYQKIVTVKDEPPFELEVIHGCNLQQVTIPASSKMKVSYQVLAVKRGLFPFGQINLMFPGKLGLFNQRYSLPCPQSIKVLPDLARILHDGLTRQIGSELTGVHRQRLYGVGGEFAQLREFVPGDDLRKVNWKVTAHMRKPMVNQFESEKDQNVFLLFDTGRLLFDQVNEITSRLDFIIDSAILLAYNVLQHGDMVGVLAFDTQVNRYLPPGKGVVQLRYLINQLYDVTATMAESDYREAFQFWSSRSNKRSLLFVYTDLIDAESSRELINQLTILRQHHLVVCILLQQPVFEQISQENIADEVTAFRKGIALELYFERERLKRILINQGITIIETAPSNIQRVVVDHYVFLKNQGLF